LRGARILIVDDEASIRRILEVSFEKNGWRPLVAQHAREALETLRKGQIDCVLSDVTMPGMSGYELLREIKSLRPELPVVIMTAFGTIPQAVQAIRDGAFEYVTKPFDLDHLKKIVSASLSDVKKPKKSKPQAAPGSAFIAEAPAMVEVLETVKQVADSRATVLITGESGVGKEVVARALHDFSPRSAKSFVAVSCAALPESLLESELFGHEKGAFTGADQAKAGRFELADQGTLFLDEIGEIPLQIQVKLLRVLQERSFERLGSSEPKQVDVRLVTATNRDLQVAVDQGIFRLDLMYRLQVIELHIPPLRERVEDIVPLAGHFLGKYCAENSREPLELDQAAIDALQSYQWPGNVRELENTIERAVVLAKAGQDILDVSLLPKSVLAAA
jgi:two-component system, NtrC family, response regulator AtoC